MPTGELTARSLANLSSFVLWRLEYERRAGVTTLFENVPPFQIEEELLNLMWWQSLDATKEAAGLVNFIEAKRRELKDIISDAEQSDSPASYLEYAKEITEQIEAASELIERLRDARI